MNPLVAPLLYKEAQEVLNFATIIGPVLDAMVGTNVLIQSVSLRETQQDNPSAVEIDITSVTKNTDAITDDDETFAAGKVVLFNAGAGAWGATYRVVFTVTTTDGQTLTVIQPIELVG